MPTPWAEVGGGDALLTNEKWIRTRPRGSVVVQVGANDHSEAGVSGGQDVVPECIARGWRALLLEPVPELHNSLARRYRHNRQRVRTLNAAICPPNPTAKTRGRSCTSLNTSMWHIETTNTTGNWGSNDSDVRCITENHPRGTRYHYLLELTSFTAAHLLKHFGPGFSPSTCMDCSLNLHRPMPFDCMRNIVWKNLRQLPVACACFERELGSETSVDLLFVDAEGHDDHVLASYPFNSHPPQRLVFEPKHISARRFHVLARRLNHLGYQCLDELREGLNCSARAHLGTSSWHRVRSPSAGISW